MATAAGSAQEVQLTKTRENPTKNNHEIKPKNNPAAVKAFQAFQLKW